MTYREPKFIYFDLGNVLLFFSHQRAAKQMAAVANVPERIAWEIVYEKTLENDYESGRVTSRQFYDQFCRASGTCPDYQQLIHATSDIFDINTEIIPIVLHLHRARYRLGILSNTNEAHWQWICNDRYAIKDFFSVYALSFEIGAMKPEPLIYRAAADLARVTPDEIFYCDDRPENVEGAREAGFDVVLFENARQLAAELRLRKLRWNY